MTTRQDSLLGVLDRAGADPGFLAELAAQPLQTMLAAGVRISTADLKQLLSIEGATDAELLEVLRVRLAHTTADDSAGCGGR
jgi:hypothetical protein